MGCSASKGVEPTQPDPGAVQRGKTKVGAGAQDTDPAWIGAIVVASGEGGGAPLSVQLRLDVVHGLEAHDFTDLWHEKLAAHLAGTREWAFKEIFAWLDATSDAAQLFWLMGGGGVGKSVLTAELLHRAYRSNRVVAWHFCRHDNPQQSSPDALLRSLAAMLCARLPGYKEALSEVSAELLKSTDPKELFAALFTAPLQKVKDPETPSLIILDALDELPKQGQKPLLSVIAAQLSTLPKWLRLFVTSREEPQIKVALARFKPKELRADAAKTRADVEVRWGGSQQHCLLCNAHWYTHYGSSHSSTHYGCTGRGSTDNGYGDYGSTHYGYAHYGYSHCGSTHQAVLAVPTVVLLTMALLTMAVLTVALLTMALLH